MNKLLFILILFSGNLLAQYSNSNNQLQYVSGLQIKDNGEVLYNKKKWNKRIERKQNRVLIINDEKTQTNNYNEGPIKIPKHKNKVEVKYKNIKADELEVEYVFQGVREEKNDVTSLTNYQDKKIINFTQCVGKKCLTLTENFCAELNKNIGMDQKAAVEAAKQCLSFSKGMASFNPEDPTIKDLKKIHNNNLSAIDGRLTEFFDYKSNLGTSTEFELEKMISLGQENQDYFNLLISVLNTCDKNF